MHIKPITLLIGFSLLVAGIITPFVPLAWSAADETITAPKAENDAVSEKKPTSNAVAGDEQTPVSELPVAAKEGASKPQIVIEARFVEINPEGLDSMFRLETQVMPPADAKAFLEMITKAGGTDILSAPKVTVRNGEEASIKIVTEMLFPESWNTNKVPAEPIFGEPTEVGVSLELTATAHPNEKTITVSAHPTVTEFQGMQDVKLGSGETVQRPMLSTQSINTELIIKDGDTALLCGAATTQTTTVEDKVPLLGSIPLLGRLFSIETEIAEQRQLLVLITPEIINHHGTKKSLR